MSPEGVAECPRAVVLAAMVAAGRGRVAGEQLESECLGARLGWRWPEAAEECCAVRAPEWA